jgi:hypothetical protein
MAAAIDGAGGHGHLLETMIVRIIPAGSRAVAIHCLGFVLRETVSHVGVPVRCLF